MTERWEIKSVSFYAEMALKLVIAVHIAKDISLCASVRYPYKVLNLKLLSKR